MIIIRIVLPASHNPNPSPMHVHLPKEVPSCLLFHVRVLLLITRFVCVCAPNPTQPSFFTRCHIENWHVERNIKNNLEKHLHVASSPIRCPSPNAPRPRYTTEKTKENKKDNQIYSRDSCVTLNWTLQCIQK